MILNDARDTPATIPNAIKLKKKNFIFWFLASFFGLWITVVGCSVVFLWKKEKKINKTLLEQIIEMYRIW